MYFNKLLKLLKKKVFTALNKSPTKHFMTVALGNFALHFCYRFHRDSRTFVCLKLEGF